MLFTQMDEVGEQAEWLSDSGSVKPSVNPGIPERNDLAQLASYRCRSFSLAVFMSAS